MIPAVSAKNAVMPLGMPQSRAKDGAQNIPGKSPYVSTYQLLMKKD